MNPKVKFCGMTNLADLAAGEALDVDFFGFIFVPSSPRSISLEQALQLRPAIKNAKTVGVITDMPPEDIQSHITTLKLDYIQLHGNPDLNLCNQFTVPAIQAFRGLPRLETLEQYLKVCPYVLIDKEDQKPEADFPAIAALPENIRSKIFLAGGLTPLNVKHLAQTINPFALDCARGIESTTPGKKDHALMASFMAQYQTDPSRVLTNRQSS